MLAEAGVSACEDRVRLQRLAYFGRVALHGGPQLVALIVAEGRLPCSWLRMVEADLAWLGSHHGPGDWPRDAEPWAWARAAAEAPK
eukprot:6089015-Lingulodinium_polyedra.AAC.1